MSREDILKRVWDEHTIVAERTIDVHMARLRKKLGAYGKYIKNKAGIWIYLRKKQLNI